MLATARAPNPNPNPEPEPEPNPVPDPSPRPWAGARLHDGEAVLPPLGRGAVGDEHVEGRGAQDGGEGGERLGREDAVEGVDVREVEACAWRGLGARG